MPKKYMFYFSFNWRNCLVRFFQWAELVFLDIKPIEAIFGDARVLMDTFVQSYWAILWGLFEDGPEIGVKIHNGSTNQLNDKNKITERYVILSNEAMFYADGEASRHICGTYFNQIPTRQVQWFQ